MKHQQVSVDFWSMAKSMVTYGALTALVWVMLRLFSAVFSLPHRLRAQQHNLENTLRELQARYPELNITEEDLKNADKELEQFLKEDEDAKALEDTPVPGTSKDSEDLVKPGTSTDPCESGSSDKDVESKKSI